MTKTFEEVPVATVEVIPTFDGNEIKFKPSSKLENYLIAEGEVELYLRTQHQPLPVVPEDVDKAIKYLKKHNNSTLSDLDDILTAKGFRWLNDFQFKDRRFGVGGLNNKLFILSHLAVTGYEVEKPHLFYLKNRLTTEYLARDDFSGNYCHVKGNNISNPYTKEFTQKEIDSMVNVDGYEKIEVDDAN